MVPIIQIHYHGLSCLPLDFSRPIRHLSILSDGTKITTVFSLAAILSSSASTCLSPPSILRKNFPSARVDGKIANAVILQVKDCNDGVAFMINHSSL